MNDEDDYDGLSGPYNPVGVSAAAFIVVVTIVGIILYALGFMTPARAHEAISGMRYDFWCCNGTSDWMSGDCQAIPEEAVRVINGGYQITLKPGDHRLATRVHVFQKTQAETRWSTDGQYHLCLYPSEATARCFYAPPPAT